MDSNVAEGISTSLETRTSVPQPLELHAPEGVASLPTAHLHVNDLGLTPSPGSQLQQCTDLVQASSRQAEHECADRNGQPTKFDDSQDCVNQSGAGFGEIRNDHDGRAICLPVKVNAGMIAGQEDAYDPLFDAEFSIPELDTVLCSRKRTGEEAFSLDFELWDPPEKRHHVESPQNPSVSSPDETPSLLSADSSTRGAHGETAPHTPVVAEGQQSPSLFEAFDSLFGDTRINVPLELADVELLPNFEQEFDLAQNFSFNDVAGDETSKIPSIFNPGAASSITEHILQDEERTTVQPSMSEATKERFSLVSQDVIASATREVLQIKKEPEYMSPYPISGGPLGYLPSAPGIHVKYVEVAEDQTNHRLSALRNKIQQLTYERNHYKKALSQHAPANPATGKTVEQMLREENAMLRRVSSRHQGRVEQYKQEAAEWKNRLHELGVIYNNLLYEIGVQKRIPEIAPAPKGYKPPRKATSSGGQLALPNHEVVCLDSRAVAQATPTASVSLAGTPVSEPSSRPNSQPPPLLPVAQPGLRMDGQQSHDPSMGTPQPPVSDQQPVPVTIDLTDEQENTSSTAPECTPEVTGRRMEMLQTLRNKKYGWLQDGNQRTNTSTRPTPQSRPSVSEVVPRGNNLEESGSFDDELARVMEEELARA